MVVQWGIYSVIHLKYVFIGLLILKGIVVVVEGSTPYPYELCARGLLMLKAVVMVVGGLLYIHQNYVQRGICSWRGSTPYPHELCAVGLLMPKGVVAVEGGLLHIHLNCVQEGSGHWGIYSVSMSISIWIVLSGVVMVEWIYSISIWIMRYRFVDA